jgi:hypothetical protein
MRGYEHIHARCAISGGSATRYGTSPIAKSILMSVLDRREPPQDTASERSANTGSFVPRPKPAGVDTAVPSCEWISIASAGVVTKELKSTGTTATIQSAGPGSNGRLNSQGMAVNEGRCFPDSISGMGCSFRHSWLCQSKVHHRLFDLHQPLRGIQGEP